MNSAKICGITLVEDAIMAAEYGASAIGFIFYRKSPRYISPRKARDITEQIKKNISFVGVFVDEPLDYIHTISEQVGLHFVQLHGNESPEYCSKVKIPVLKAFRIDDNFDPMIINRYNVHAFLFDTYRKGTPGGTGGAFNWALISNIQTETPIIISGGLNEENIIESIKAVCPNAIDINSGIESAPGIKNKEKMIALFNIVKDIELPENPFQLSGGQNRSYEL